MNSAITLRPAELSRKKADAACRIAFARFNSAFSRRNRLSSGDFSTVTPGRDTGIGLRPAHPFTQHLGGSHTQQRRDPRHRRPLRLTIRTLGDHPHRSRLQLRRVPLRGISCHDSNLPKNLESAGLWIYRCFRPDTLSEARRGRCRDDDTGWGGEQEAGRSVG